VNTANKQREELRDKPPLLFSPTIKPALLLLLLCAFLIIAWVALAPQHSAVIATAEVILKGQKHTILYKERAHIAEVFVEEGDEVIKGQTLIRLDDLELKILARSLDEQWFESQLQLAFLDATINNNEQLIVPEYLSHSANALQLSAKLVQRKTRYDIKKQYFLRELSLLEIQYIHHQEHAKSREIERQRILQQLSLMQPEIHAIEKLSSTQMVAKNSLIKLRITALELTKNAEKFSIEAQQSRLLQQKIRLEQTQRKQQRILAAQNEQHQLNRYLPKLIKDRELIQYKRKRLLIKAPINGRVQHLHVNAAGSHLEANQPIMEIIPSSAPLLIEARISPKDIEKTLKSNQAKVRLSAYNSRQTPLLNAEIIRLSANTFQDHKGYKFYSLQLRIPASQLARVPYVELYPGMPAEVIVVTKARTILQYLFNQLTQISQRSLRES